MPNRHLIFTKEFAECFFGPFNVKTATSVSLKWLGDGFSFYTARNSRHQRIRGGCSEQVTLAISHMKNECRTDTETCQYWWRTHLGDSSSILDVTVSGIKGQNGLTVTLKPHNIPIIGLKRTACQRAADTKQFGKAVQAIIRLLWKKCPIFTANDPV